MEREWERESKGEREREREREWVRERERETEKRWSREREIQRKDGAERKRRKEKHEDGTIKWPVTATFNSIIIRVDSRRHHRHHSHIHCRHYTTFQRIWKPVQSYYDTSHILLLLHCCSCETTSSPSFLISHCSLIAPFNRIEKSFLPLILTFITLSLSLQWSLPISFLISVLFYSFETWFIFHLQFLPQLLSLPPFLSYHVSLFASLSISPPLLLHFSPKSVISINPFFYLAGGAWLLKIWTSRVGLIRHEIPCVGLLSVLYVSVLYGRGIALSRRNRKRREEGKEKGERRGKRREEKRQEKVRKNEEE